MYRVTRLWGLLAAVLLLGGGLLAACGDDDSGDGASESSTTTSTTAASSTTEPDEGDDWDAVVAAALEEGSLHFESPLLDPDLQALVDGFTAEYPEIEVTYQRDNGPALAAKWAQELATGNARFDVLIVSDATVLTDLSDELVDLTDIPAYADLPAEWQSGNRVGVFAAFQAAVVNTDRVAEADRPQSYEDFLDPRFANREIAVIDPTTQSVLPILWSTWATHNGGISFAEAIGAQNPQVFGGSPDAIQALSAGQVSISMGMSGPTPVSRTGWLWGDHAAVAAGVLSAS